MSAHPTTNAKPQLAVSTTHPPVNEEQDYDEMLFGRGAGDPDVMGYPGEDE